MNYKYYPYLATAMMIVGTFALFMGNYKIHVAADVFATLVLVIYYGEKITRELKRVRNYYDA